MLAGGGGMSMGAAPGTVCILGAASIVAMAHLDAQARLLAISDLAFLPRITPVSSTTLRLSTFRR